MLLNNYLLCFIGSCLSKCVCAVWFVCVLLMVTPQLPWSIQKCVCQTQVSSSSQRVEKGLCLCSNQFSILLPIKELSLSRHSPSETRKQNLAKRQKTLCHELKMLSWLGLGFTHIVEFPECLQNLNKCKWREKCSDCHMHTYIVPKWKTDIKCNSLIKLGQILFSLFGFYFRVK